MVVVLVVVAGGLVAGLVAAGACGVGASPVVVTGAGDVGAAGPAPPSSGPITTTATTARSGEVLITVRSPVPIVVAPPSSVVPATSTDPSVTTMNAETSVWSTSASLDVEHVADEIDVAGARTGREGERGIAGTGDDRVAGAVAAPSARHGSQRCGLVAGPEERLARSARRAIGPAGPAHHDRVGTIGHDERRRAGVDRYVGLRAHRVRGQLPVHRLRCRR